MPSVDSKLSPHLRETWEECSFGDATHYNIVGFKNGRPNSWNGYINRRYGPDSNTEGPIDRVKKYIDAAGDSRTYADYDSLEIVPMREREKDTQKMKLEARAEKLRSELGELDREIEGM